ncbi:MAG: hypothetical protein QNJ61_07015 [Desulfobacterales bacterium]|nr:hypothetical protein [Desulfobacterales bacterium]
MSLLERLTGATPEKLEHKGDRLMAAGRWGEAMLVYESARDKLAKRSGTPGDRQHRLSAKIRQARQALARDHWRQARDLMDGHYWAEAHEMLTLAIEVSTDQDFQRTLERALRELEGRYYEVNAPEPAVRGAVRRETPAGQLPATGDDDYFLALCHTLPAAVGQAYQRYGDDFKRGYIALNRGAFENAVRHLEQAHKAHPEPDSYIPLELATAYLNLNRQSAAHDLLRLFRRHHPEALPAYQLLCEIYWDQKNFDRALALLDTLPTDLATSVAALLLRGETLTRAGKHESARQHYHRFIDTHGWDPTVAHKLARVCLDLQDRDRARELYRGIIDRCRGCGARIDPQIRHEYAELCFAESQYDTDLLESYLALVQEIPTNAAQYYRRVARIYAHQGHDHEARRFIGFARQVEAHTSDKGLPRDRP